MRNNFTAQTKRDAHKRSAGICECHLIPWLRRPNGCGARLSNGNTFYEHIDPDAISSRNDIDNCAVLVKTCWREKTDHYDRKVIAKSNHTRDRARGIRRPTFGRPLPGTRASGIKLSMNGAPPIWRDSGRPLWSSKR